MKHRSRRSIIHRDLLIVALSIILAILMVKVGVIAEFLSITEGVTILGSFIAGLFFTSVFTIAPAGVALGALASHHSVLGVALMGAIGASIGDVIIFLFIRDSVSDDIAYAVRKIHIKKLLAMFHLGFLRVIAPIIGALIIASPLPDELGLMLMGISRVRTAVLIPIAFAMNFIGILAIAAIANAL